MWLFDRLSVRLKLALLAGVPVLGALILSALIALDAQQRAATAKAIGSVEDLVQLTERVASVVHELQAERSQTAFSTGVGDANGRALAEQERRTDRALDALRSFLGARDAAALPAVLRENLQGARHELVELSARREGVRSPQFDLYEYLEFHDRTIEALIAATSALSQLTDDGELMLSISRLVAAMQVSEQTSREHALLSYVFGKKEFPPGTFRLFVSLLTEQEVYASSLRAAASRDDYARFQAIIAGPRAAKALSMRKVALDATDGTLDVDPRAWFDAKGEDMRALRRLEDGMAEAMHRAVAKKMRETRAAIRLGIGLTAAVLFSSTLLAWAVARSMTRSVGVLFEAAEAVERERDFSLRAQKTSHDELGTLTDAFNSMLSGIQERDRELESHRQNLEALVRARTLELSKRNEQMRLVLDNVEEGLAMVDARGNLLEECSQAFAAVFGAPETGTPFQSVIAAGDASTAEALAMGYEQMMDDFLPPEVAAAQMPTQLNVGSRQYALVTRPVVREGKAEGALLVVRDITAEIAAQHAEALQREQIASFRHLMQDRSGFCQFFAEATALVERIRDGGPGADVEVRRAIHTLKGNTALYEIRSVSEAAHALEGALTEGATELARKAQQELLAAWNRYAGKIAPLLGENLGRGIEVSRSDFEQALALVRQRAPHASIERWFVRWQREPVRLRFARVEEQLQALALRLNKPVPDVVIRSDDVRLPSEPFREFWSSFAHVVRNTVDHGIGTAEERERSGKPARTRIELSAVSDATALVIEIKDDGPGIDWSRLAERAAAAGLPARSRADLIVALTTDGVSTASRVTETSGRGVGMSAVLAAVTHLRGELLVDSEPGQGTRLRFVFPALDDETARPAVRARL